MKIAALQSTDRRCAMATRGKDHSVPKASSVPAVMTGGRSCAATPTGFPCRKRLKPVWTVLPAAASAARGLGTLSLCDPTSTCGRWRQRQQILNNKASQALSQGLPHTFTSFAPQNSVTYTVMIWTLTGRRRCTWAKQLTSGPTGRQWWIVGLNKEICLLILCSKICTGRKHAGSQRPVFIRNLFLIFITNQIWKFIPRRKRVVICTK